MSLNFEDVTVSPNPIPPGAVSVHDLTARGALQPEEHVEEGVHAGALQPGGATLALAVDA